mgnify:CR=1 FL=1
MPDLHGWIAQQITRVENDLRAVDKEHGRSWTTRWNASSDTFTIYDGNSSAVAADVLPAAAGLIALNDPATVLRRCAADRKILAVHAPAGTKWDPYACNGCGVDSEYGHEVDHTNDCETLQALAEGYGLTEEQRAQLDRPEAERPEPGPGFQAPAPIVEGYRQMWAHVLGTRPVEPRPEVKAMEILKPELKKISGYVPTTEEQQ